MRNFGEVGRSPSSAFNFDKASLPTFFATKKVGAARKVQLDVISFDKDKPRHAQSEETNRYAGGVFTRNRIPANLLTRQFVQRTPLARRSFGGTSHMFRNTDESSSVTERQHNSKKHMSIRPIKSIVQSQPTIEGAGVKLRRAFGFGNTGDFDPFLLLDDFRNENPEDYLAGFPWHPHRGIETITYVLKGTVSHGDSLGNSGTLGAGDVQWMTAGSGILHQEMPKGDDRGKMHGFQLWANLPSSLKMTKPRYQDVPAVEIPEVGDEDGTLVRVVCGSFWGKTGPVEGIAADPRYLDVWVPPFKRKSLPVETTQHAFAYIFEGSGTFKNASTPFNVKTDQVGTVSDVPAEDEVGNRTLVLFENGDEVTVQAGEKGIRFLLVSGKPLEEPVAWYGPIVMNTQEQLRQAYAELHNGTFIKERSL